MEWTKKFFVGSNEVGERIFRAMEKIAKEKFGGNASKMFVHDFCEKYGYDPETGECLAGHKKGKQ